MSLELQRAFGLRREESIKIKPLSGGPRDRVVLHGVWTKGGRARTVPILTAAQREVLDRAKALVRFTEASLIPKGKRIGSSSGAIPASVAERVGQMHGCGTRMPLRDLLALTGFAAPAVGGPGRTQLTPEQREADTDARLLISAELGHGRGAITAAYLGR